MRKEAGWVSAATAAAAGCPRVGQGSDDRPQQPPRATLLLPGPAASAPGTPAPCCAAVPASRARRACRAPGGWGGGGAASGRLRAPSAGQAGLLRAPAVASLRRACARPDAQARDQSSSQQPATNSRTQGRPGHPRPSSSKHCLGKQSKAHVSSRLYSTRSIDLSATMMTARLPTKPVNCATAPCGGRGTGRRRRRGGGLLAGCGARPAQLPAHRAWLLRRSRAAAAAEGLGSGLRATGQAAESSGALTMAVPEIDRK